MPKPQKNTNKMREIPEEEAFEMKFQAEMQQGFEASKAQDELEKRTRSARTAARAEARASSGAAGATPGSSTLGSSSASAWTPTLAGHFFLTPLDLAPQHIFWCIYVPNPLCEARVTTAEHVFFLFRACGGILYLRMAVVPPIRTFFCY